MLPRSIRWFAIKSIRDALLVILTLRFPLPWSVRTLKEKKNDYCSANSSFIGCGVIASAIN